jgi:hypothetical protein
VVPSTHAAEAFANGTKAISRVFGKTKIIDLNSSGKKMSGKKIITDRPAKIKVTEKESRENSMSWRSTKFATERIYPNLSYFSAIHFFAS